jgi:cell division protein FtsQ
MAGRVGALKEREKRLRKMGPRRRLRAPRLAASGRARLAAGLLVLLAAAAVAYWLGLRTTTEEPSLRPTQEVAAIGAGSSAVPVAPDGTILRSLPSPADAGLAVLPVSSPPDRPRLAGTLLEQVRVLAAAPPPLRPLLRSSHFGGSGVAVELGSGVELRFGDASRAAAKWKAAAAVLADPSTTALDYVDLQAPSRPAVAGSGHTLPPPP